MKQIRLVRALGLAAVTSMVSLTMAAQTGETAPIQQKLNSQFKLTTITADRSDIVTAGDVAVIHKPGLIMYAVASPMPPSNTYKNGKIGQGWGGFGKDMLITMAVPGGGTAADYPHRPFAPEEKCWVTGIQAQKDGVLFQLYSDPYDGIRYYANLKIPFPNKKEVPSVDAVVQVVQEVLTVVPAENQGEQPAVGPAAGTAPNPAQDGPPPPIAGQYSAPGGSHLLLLPDNTFTKFVGGGQGHGQYAVDGDNLTLTFTSTGFSQHFKIQSGNLLDVNTSQEWTRTGDAPAAAPAPLPEIAPPPPPTDAVPPPTISLGQTMDQVTAGFGQPLRVARLGVKTIFYYRDMKVTFTNGKVSSVE
jgi:hypothetical protein